MAAVLPLYTPRIAPTQPQLHTRRCCHIGAPPSLLLREAPWLTGALPALLRKQTNSAGNIRKKGQRFFKQLAFVTNAVHYRADTAQCGV